MLGSVTCDFPECGRRAAHLGLCETHYGQRRRGETLRPIIVFTVPKGLCVFPDCDRTAATSLGLCRAHNTQRKRGHELKPAGKPFVRYPAGSCCAVSGCDRSISARQLCVNHYARAKTFGLSVDALVELLSITTCRICGSGGRMFIDHDHLHCHRGCAICIRGMLCSNCNGGLGFFQDRPDLLRKAAEYLENVPRPVQSVP
jgi:hypothetical protein